MPIITSEITSDSTDLSGRRYINVRAPDHVGAMFRATCLVRNQTPAEVLAEMVTRFEADAKQAELDANLANAQNDEAPSPTFNWCTRLEFGAVLREAYRDARGKVAARLAWYVAQFGLTDAQLRNLFGVTAAQLPALKTRIAALAAKYMDLQDEVGE